MDIYLEAVQKDTDIRGVKTFDINESDKAIVLSLGKEMTGDNIEVLDVEEINGKTIVYI